MKGIKRFHIIFLILIFSVLCFAGSDVRTDSDFQELLFKAQSTGEVRVILKMDIPGIKKLTDESVKYKTGNISPVLKQKGFNADLKLEDAIFKTGDHILFRLNHNFYRIKRRFSTVPLIALSLSPEALLYVRKLPEVISIFEDRLIPRPEVKGTLNNTDDPDKPALDDSADIVGAAKAWSMGVTGRGWYVAVLDTGIRKTHEMFEGKNVIEACYSGEGHCPNGGTEMVGEGAAAHYYQYNYLGGFDHGTHVAGIAAGKSNHRAGIAKDSDIIAIQVFSYFPGEDDISSWDSDQIKGLEFVYQHRSNYKIAAVNLSLGRGSYSSFCNGGPYSNMVKNLMDVGIATVMATGNDSYCYSVSSPACIENAIAVGATAKNDVEAGFSNWKKGMVDLFAPGVNISSATAGTDTTYQSWSGTSMAAPHVAGAWGLLKHMDQVMSVAKALKLLKENGKMVTTKCGSGGQAARIDIGESILSLLSIAPPLNFAGEQNINRSVLQVEYLNTLSWEANPFNSNKGKNIVKYLIYTVENYELTYLDEVSSSTFMYHHRKVTQGTKYTYAIKAVTDEGEESIPAYIDVE